MKTSEHEVVFAIVNSGFAEDVMEVAREQGVRGGTILNARGVAREDAAAFFGITIHHEKEILMMVVEKNIRDNVLNAIYKEMGILNLKSKKLQLQAAQYGMAEQLTSSLSIIKDCINIVGPRSERLKQTDSSDIDCILEFTNNFIATQQRSQSTRKRYRVGENVDVKVTGKSGGHIYVASTDSNYETIKGRLDFPNNFFFYKESDFYRTLF